MQGGLTQVLGLMGRTLALVLATLLLPGVCSAGGEHVAGKVTRFIVMPDGYKFLFVPQEPIWLADRCQTLLVHVTHARVPWYSWLPFVSSNHPSAAETASAAELLRVARLHGSVVGFGYMGSGLAPAGPRCSFKSKGLRVYRDRGETFVLSFFDPI